MTAAPIGNDEFGISAGSYSRLRHKRDGRETARPKFSIESYPICGCWMLKRALRVSVQ
jgi:hypothetical protein